MRILGSKSFSPDLHLWFLQKLVKHGAVEDVFFEKAKRRCGNATSEGTTDMAIDSRNRQLKHGLPCMP